MTDYISREAAYNTIVNNYTTDTELRDLYAIPAADVAPVVHGRWIAKQRCTHYPEGKPYEADYCSACGKRGSIEYAYCPNCGAVMDGGPQDAVD